ncbi:MAG: hypothetical protein IKH26_14305 [Bacteroidaceae bacterium]|nr:hypothetical protein [Bacteroidaceae bacterium]
MFKKSYQVQHVNGLTYDFLFDMAKKLAFLAATHKHHGIGIGRKKMGLAERTNLK